MHIHQRTLSNGLRLQAIEMPASNVVTTLILVGAGSRYETKDISGISHFLEHMFFKGAKKYQTPMAVAEAVDSFGGAFNAFTGKEYAGYYVKSGQENTEKALDVLSDMLMHSTFNPEEINRERGVILEEMAMYMDMPTYQISWDFEALAFGDQPLGWDQIGTRDLVNTVTQKMFQQYQQELYVPKNMVVTLAGAVNADTLDLMEQYFVFPEERDPARKAAHFQENLTTEKIKIRSKKTEQYHISFGVKAVSEASEEYPALCILSTILGGNMSSRMFQHIREQKGLCYSIRTYVDEYTDTGLMTTNAGVKLSDVLKAAEAIRFEYDDVAQNGVSDEEFLKAKNYIIGKTDLNTEDTENVAHHFAKNELLYGHQHSFSDWKKTIDAVDKSAVESLAARILVPDNYRFAGIGPDIDAAVLRAIVS